jgi:hypothetical protein
MSQKAGVEVARQMVDEIRFANMGTATRAEGVGQLLREKIVSETAMLLLCLEPTRGLDTVTSPYWHRPGGKPPEGA